MAMTVERTVSVWKPQHVSYICTRNRAKHITFAIAIGFLMINSHMLFFFKVVNFDIMNSERLQSCRFSGHKYANFFDIIWAWIDLTFSSLIPFVVLCIGNSIIIWKYYASLKSVQNNLRTNKAYAKTKKKSLSYLTATLIVLSGVFVLTTSPVCVYNIIEYFLHDSHEMVRKNQGTMQLTWAVVNILMYTNNSLNFYLYFLSGSKFRKEFSDLISNCWKKQHTSSSLTHSNFFCLHVSNKLPFLGQSKHVLCDLPDYGSNHSANDAYKDAVVISVAKQ